MIYIITCRNCGTKFQTSRKNQKFCSDKCRTYFRKKINIIIAPAKPIKVEPPYFGKNIPRHRKPLHIKDITEKTIKKIKKSGKK